MKNNTPIREQLWNKNYITVLFANFFTTIPFFMLLTTMPIYVVDILHKNEQSAGLMNAVFLLAAVICRPISGKLVDDFGLKKITRVSMLLFFISTILYLSTDNYVLLLVIRFINGIFFAIASTAILTVGAHSVPITRQGEGIGYIATVANLGTVVGPFIGLTLARMSEFNWMFILASTALLISFFVSLLIKMPDDENETEREPLRISQLFEKSALSVSMVMFVIGLAYSSVVSFFPVYAKEMNLLEAGAYFFVVYATFSIFSRLIIGRIYDLRGVNTIAYPAIALFAIGTLLLSQSHTSFMILASGALIGVGYGSLVPTFQTLAIQLAPKNRRGAATATYFAFLDGGISFGSFALGSLVGLLGYVNMYISISFIIFCCLGIYYCSYGKEEKRKLSGSGSRGGEVNQ